MSGAAAARAERPATTAADIAAALGGSRSGSGWSASCPAHEDTTPSLSLSERDGTVLVRCHAGCEQSAVVAALRERGLWPTSPRTRPTGPPSATWTYRDAAGVPVRRTARWDRPGGRKDIRAQVPDGRGGWRAGDVGTPRPLYRLPEILAAHDAEILIVEGEKAADAAAALRPDYAVTTSAHGAASAARSDWSPLAGRRVVVWPDADDPGRQYAADVVRLARAAGAAQVRVVDLPPGLPTGWDLADNLPTGWTSETVRELLAGAPSADGRMTTRVLSLDDFLSVEFPPRENIIDPVFPRQGLGMIHAWRGLGKTHFALSLALAAWAGAPFLRWRATRAVNVLFVDGEMRGVDLQERIARHLKVLPQRGETSAFRVITPDLQSGGIPDIGTTEGQRWLDAALGEAELILLDNLSSLMGGADNDDVPWLPLKDWLLRLRASGRSAVIVHHDGKNQNQRGISKKEDNLDTVFHLRKPDGYKESDGARFVVHFPKHRGFYGRDCEPFEAALIETEAGAYDWALTDIEDARTAQVAAMLNDGCTVSEIAKELNIGRATVQRHKDKAATRGLLS